ILGTGVFEHRARFGNEGFRIALVLLRHLGIARGLGGRGGLDLVTKILHFILDLLRVALRVRGNGGQGNPGKCNGTIGHVRLSTVSSAHTRALSSSSKASNEERSRAQVATPPYCTMRPASSWGSQRSDLLNTSSTGLSSSSSSARV